MTVHVNPGSRQRPSAAGPSAVDAYGLVRPDLAEARTLVDHVCLDRADVVWSQLLARARLSGRDTGEDAVEALVAAMAADPDPVLGLAARALTIRLTAFRHLAEAQRIMRQEST